MQFRIPEDIHSITDLKRNTNSILTQIHKTKRPVVLTANGKVVAVLLDAQEYEKITNAFNLLQQLIPAEEDIQAGRTKDARSFFKDFRNAREI